MGRRAGVYLWLRPTAFAALLLFASQDCTARNDLLGEHVAPFLDRVTAKDWVPESHPQQTFEGTPGLPIGCITYEERYSKIDRDHDKRWVFDGNDVDPSARYVMLLRLHYGVQWKEDLVLFLRSAMLELSEAGIHMYLLIQDAGGQNADADDTPEKFRHSIPLSLRPIAFFFDQSDIHNQYHRLHQFKAHARDYLPVIWFMHRYPGYQFIWHMEYDVRYTGPSLGEFLHSLLYVALETMQQNDTELEGPVQGHSLSVESRKFQGSATLPEDADLLPDLLLIGSGTHTFPVTNESQPRDPEHWNFTQLHHRQIQVFGMSRKLGSLMHSYSLEGLGGYIEEFVPTLAKESGLRVVSVPIPLFGGDSFHCCFNASEVYYEDWFTSKECRQYALLHPVKLNSPVWGPQDT